jgi:dienelactone hydrolase
MGETFHRLSMVAEPRPVGVAILNQIEARPELDPHSVAFMGMSLGGYLALRMACHDPRIKAVAAISPPYSADVYWNITLVALRRELAALYAMDEKEMGKAIDKITLADLLAKLECPLMVAGGGHDHITPGSEAWRIFEDARCERELIFYPKGAHDCFNVLADLRPRMVSWIAHQLSKHHVSDGRGRLVSDGALDGAWMTAEAIHPEFADALLGEGRPLQWHQLPAAGMPVRWDWPWNRTTLPRIEVVHRQAGNGAGEPSRAYTTLA